MSCNNLTYNQINDFKLLNKPLFSPLNQLFSQLYTCIVYQNIKNQQKLLGIFMSQISAYNAPAIHPKPLVEQRNTKRHIKIFKRQYNNLTSLL